MFFLFFVAQSRFFNHEISFFVLLVILNSIFFVILFKVLYEPINNHISLKTQLNNKIKSILTNLSESIFTVSKTLYFVVLPILMIPKNYLHINSSILIHLFLNNLLLCLFSKLEHFFNYQLTSMKLFYQTFGYWVIATSTNSNISKEYISLGILKIGHSVKILVNFRIQFKLFMETKSM